MVNVVKAELPFEAPHLGSTERPVQNRFQSQNLKVRKLRKVDFIRLKFET
jgi:hypothetical protein